MNLDILCKRCDTKIGNDNGEFLIPVKTRTRFNYLNHTLNVQCHQCYYVNIFQFNPEERKFLVVDDCDKINNRYQLDNQNNKKK